MPDILHKLNVSAPPSAIYGALCDALPEFKVDGERVVATMHLAHREDDARIAWRCIDGPPDWVGTIVSFDLTPKPGGAETIIRFGHRHWKEATDFMSDCSAQWAFFLLHLKSRLEVPEPEDVYV